MDSFKDLNLSPSLQRSIDELGYEKPSPIQAQALPLLLGDATDFIGLAATGTGKTAAFSIPLVERIDAKNKEVQALVLCPTRELAIQVTGQINLLGKYSGVKALPVYGGAGYREQIDGLRHGVPVVVGTPGRVIDHIEKGTLKLDGVTTVILDEADEMISMGFKDELDAILSRVPKENSNIWLFSATMSREVRRVADDYLSDPAQVQVNRTEMVPSTVEQTYYFTKENLKPELVCKIIDMADDFYGIIFCQTKALVTDLTNMLLAGGYKADCLHGDMDQRARERTMQAFRERIVNVLVCTDVASRGLDVKEITHVINYSLPRELDSYVHRIGRTGRSGQKGSAISLVTGTHKGLLVRIERLTKSKILEAKLPSRREVGQKRVSRIFSKFQSIENHEKATELLPEDVTALLDTMDPREIAGRFVSMLIPDFFQGSAPKEFSEVMTRDRSEGPSKKPFRSERGSDGGDKKPFKKKKYGKPFAGGPKKRWDKKK
jgi:ATP-dependent RNA helicase DeaD